jgi:ribosomal protein S18 acetylase RimI-like enzyme
MHLEFRRATIPDEIPELRAFDRRVFPKADLFTKDEWMEYESHWMTVEGAKVGCCAFERDVDFREDIRKDRRNPRRKGSLYITTTGILPAFRGKGLGKMLKVWETAYAEFHGFNRIVTNSRMGNAAIIGLNISLGYRIIRITPRYYSGPTDATVVMELKLNGASANLV